MMHKHWRDVDPATQWYYGVIGRLLRWRWIWSLTGTKAVLAVIAFSLSHNWAGAILATLSVSCLLGLWYIRRTRLRRITSDDWLHKLTHRLRDKFYEISSSGDKPCTKSDIRSFTILACESTAHFFRTLQSDKTVNCSIRLAKGQVYETIGRSLGMDVSREANSEPISMDDGMPAALLSVGGVGAYIIQDLNKLELNGPWKSTQNDGLHDVRSLMVCAINGWEVDGKQMLGILSVTSAWPKQFHAGHTLPMKAIADVLALIYPLILGTVPGPPVRPNRQKPPIVTMKLPPTPEPDAPLGVLNVDSDV